MGELWVTDRLPKQADASEDGMVATKAGPRPWESIVIWEKWLPLGIVAGIPVGSSGEKGKKMVGRVGSEGKKKKKKKPKPPLSLRMKEKEAEIAALASKLIEAANGIDKMKVIIKGLAERLDVASQEAEQRNKQIDASIKLIDEYQEERVVHKEQMRRMENSYSHIKQVELDWAKRGFLSRLFRRSPT